MLDKAQARDVLHVVRLPPNTPIVRSMKDTPRYDDFRI